MGRGIPPRPTDGPPGLRRSAIQGNIFHPRRSPCYFSMVVRLNAPAGHQHELHLSRLLTLFVWNDPEHYPIMADLEVIPALVR